MAKLTRFIDDNDPDLRLCCPQCGSRLLCIAGRLHCIKVESHEYHKVDGIPILINPDRSIFRADDFFSQAPTTFKQSGTLAMRIARWLPSPSRNVSGAACYARLASELRSRAPERRRVLVVGSGDGSANYGDLLGVDHAVILETDVSLAGSAKIVCDGSDLPFEDGSFDLIVCVAVLEHVLEPHRCVEEFHRVLRSDGIVYASTPFMQQVHMGEYDFTRFTRSGHRWLFRNFDELASGISTGPASALVWSLEYFLLSWSTSVAWRRIAKALTRILFGWLNWLDHLLAYRTPALDGAGGFYFIGRRAEQVTLQARDMVGYYRGADDRK